MGFGEPVEPGDEARCYQMPGRVFVVESVGDVQDRYVGDSSSHESDNGRDPVVEHEADRVIRINTGDVVLRAREDNLIVVVDRDWVKPHR